MNSAYTHLTDLAKEVQPPEKGILSRSVYQDERLKMVLFGFAQGEELSEHTASMPVILHFLRGEAKLTLGDDTLEAKPGTPVADVLTLLKYVTQERGVTFVYAASDVERNSALVLKEFLEQSKK